jgi:hypothetical protein
MIISVMALGVVTLRDWWRVMWREVLAGLALESILGSIWICADYRVINVLQYLRSALVPRCDDGWVFTGRGGVVGDDLGIHAAIPAAADSDLTRSHLHRRLWPRWWT